MIYIRQVPEVDIRKVYPSLYFKAFKKPFDTSYPPVLIIAENESEMLGWVSGYSMNQKTFYLQRAGKAQRFIGNKRSPRYMIEVFKFLKDSLKYKYVNTYVANDNNPAIVSALKSGFIIDGVRVTMKKKTMLSLSRKL